MDPAFSAQFLHQVRLAAEPDAVAGNQAALLGLYDRIIQGDFEGMGAFLTEDAVLQISGSGPFAGIWHGKAAVIEAARANFGQVSQQQPQIKSILTRGNSSAVLFEESGIFTIDGRGYRAKVVQWFTFRDGKICEVDEILALNAVA